MKRAPSTGPDSARSIVNSALMPNASAMPQASAPRVSSGRAAAPLPSGFARYRLLPEDELTQDSLAQPARVINAPVNANLHAIDASIRAQYV
ncbi:MAG: hypothetical protein Q7U14_18505, partial [Lacisediminimonas sp.]|nr:hypothetical protein [Lacisediminimonas sp.]